MWYIYDSNYNETDWSSRVEHRLLCIAVQMQTEEWCKSQTIPDDAPTLVISLGHLTPAMWGLNVTWQLINLVYNMSLFIDLSTPSSIHGNCHRRCIEALCWGHSLYYYTDDSRNELAQNIVFVTFGRILNFIRKSFRLTEVLLYLP